MPASTLTKRRPLAFVRGTYQFIALLRSIALFVVQKMDLRGTNEQIIGVKYQSIREAL